MTDNSEIKIKKKRGRKPKNNIIINENPEFNSKNEPSLVLKLNKDNYINNEDIDSNNINLNNELNNIDTINNNNILNNNENNIKEQINEKCWNCSYNFYIKKFGLPIKNENNIFYTIGNFCSLECASRYAKENYNNNNFYEIYSLLNLYNLLLNKDNKNINIPKSRLSIDIFGGDLTIDEYREKFQNYNIIHEPIVKEIKCIDTITNLVHNNNLNNLKLYRTKLLNNKNNISNIMKLDLN